MMKRFLLRLLVYVSVYVILHVIVVCAVGPYVTFYHPESGGHMFSRTKEIPEHKNPDVLFLGSSHAYRGFDTRIFDKAGIVSFNLGSSGQTPMQTEVLLKKYLDEICPKCIVFDVYPIVFQMDGVESTADLISCDHIDAEICKLAFKSGNVKIINTLIYGLYQEYVRDIRNTLDERTIIDGDLYVPGGYVERLTNSMYLDSSSIEEKTIEVLPKQLSAFGRCIQMIQDRGIPFLLVQAPLPQSTYHNLLNYNEFNDVIASFGDYIDFNEVLRLDDSCFYDADHLNQKGVELYDDCLIRVLDSLKFPLK